MSSAILYLAIVAIWAVVLVPRWLRQSHVGTPSANAGTAPAVTESDVALSGVAEDEFADQEVAGDLVAAEGPAAGPSQTDGAADRGRGPSPGRREPAARPGREPAARPGREPAARPGREQAAASSAARRTRILQARRRTLITLIALTAGAVAMALAHLAASWVTIPPAALLVFFLLLLRTAARIDAQRARDARVRAPAESAGDVPAQRSSAPETAEPAEDAPAELATVASARTAGVSESGAEIIDISGRAEDQPYDQYVDAEARAVGD